MDEYDKIRELGRGSHGEAILVQHQTTKELAVAKSIRIGRDDSQAVEEAQLLQSLNHPNIIRCIRIVHEPNARLSWLIMEYADGGDLSAFTAQSQPKCEQPLHDCEIMRIFIQICLALAYLHSKNILHRDIKPQNVFLNGQGIVKLGDFGIAKALSHTLDVAQTQIGTPLYLSPEICQGDDYNAKSDMWGLGCILYELITLKSPFYAKSMPLIVTKITKATPDPLPSHVPSEIQQLVGLLLSKAPEQRPSASEALALPVVQTYLMQFASYLPRQPKRSVAPLPPPRSSVPAPVLPRIQTSLMDVLPSLHSQASSEQIESKPADMAFTSPEDLARQQFLDNQRAARLYKERMDKLKNAPSPFTESPSPPTSDYEDMLAMERRRVYEETKALHERMRMLQSSDSSVASPEV
ncbi:unnamed protein product [Aphanomyces euteiches]